MTKLSKKQKIIQEKIPYSRKAMSLSEAIICLKSLPRAKFIESVDVSINLGVDPTKSDQLVRGATMLPHGTGKRVRMAVFAQGSNADAAKAAGANMVGMNDLAESMKKGNIDYDVVIASPDAMNLVGRLGSILGPRGLMPNPKVGTVTPNITKAIENVKAGQVRYRTDKHGIINCSIGKINFESNKLIINLTSLLTDLKLAKPNKSKGIYFKQLSISTTMGPGLIIDWGSVSI